MLIRLPRRLPAPRNDEDELVAVWSRCKTTSVIARREHSEQRGNLEIDDSTSGGSTCPC